MLGNPTAVDEGILKAMGDEALGVISASWYSAALNTPDNKHFVKAIQDGYKVTPGFYTAGTYTAGLWLEAALKMVDGKFEDKPAFVKALHAVRLSNQWGLAYRWTGVTGGDNGISGLTRPPLRHRERHLAARIVGQRHLAQGRPERRLVLDLAVHVLERLLQHQRRAVGALLLVGFAGRTSLGHASYLGLSAYARA